MRGGIEKFQPFGTDQEDGNFRDSVVSLVVCLPQQLLKLILHLHLVQCLSHHGWDLVEVSHIPAYLFGVTVMREGPLEVRQLGVVALSRQLQGHYEEEMLQLGLCLLVVELRDDLPLVAAVEESHHVEVVERVRDGEVAGEALAQEVDVLAVELLLVDLCTVEVVQGVTHTYSLRINYTELSH